MFNSRQHGQSTLDWILAGRPVRAAGIAASYISASPSTTSGNAVPGPSTSASSSSAYYTAVSNQSAGPSSDPSIERPGAIDPASSTSTTATFHSAVSNPPSRSSSSRLDGFRSAAGPPTSVLALSPTARAAQNLRPTQEAYDPLRPEALPEAEIQPQPITQSASSTSSGSNRCPIHGSEMTDPITTPCNHTFCRECLDRWLRTPSKFGPRCPMDRTPLPATFAAPADRPGQLGQSTHPAQSRRLDNPFEQDDFDGSGYFPPVPQLRFTTGYIAHPSTASVADGHEGFGPESFRDLPRLHRRAQPIRDTDRRLLSIVNEASPPNHTSTRHRPIVPALTISPPATSSRRLSVVDDLPTPSLLLAQARRIRASLHTDSRPQSTTNVPLVRQLRPDLNHIPGPLRARRLNLFTDQSPPETPPPDTTSRQHQITDQPPQSPPLPPLSPVIIPRLQPVTPLHRSLANSRNARLQHLRLRLQRTRANIEQERNVAVRFRIRRNRERLGNAAWGTYDRNMQYHERRVAGLEESARTWEREVAGMETMSSPEFMEFRRASRNTSPRL